MSKASEYAQLMKQYMELSRPELLMGNSSDPVAIVNRIGNMQILNQFPMTPDLALQLADWIYDTFGEDENEHPR